MLNIFLNRNIECDRDNLNAPWPKKLFNNGVWLKGHEIDMERKKIKLKLRRKDPLVYYILYKICQ